MSFFKKIKNETWRLIKQQINEIKQQKKEEIENLFSQKLLKGEELVFENILSYIKQKQLCLKQRHLKLAMKGENFRNIQFIINQGINITNIENINFLFEIMIKHKDLKIIKRLLQVHKISNQKIYQGILKCAAHHHDEKFIISLLKDKSYESFNNKNFLGNDLVWILTMKGCSNVIKYLIDKKYFDTDYTINDIRKNTKSYFSYIIMFYKKRAKKLKSLSDQQRKMLFGFGDLIPYVYQRDLNKIKDKLHKEMQRAKQYVKNTIEKNSSVLFNQELKINKNNQIIENQKKIIKLKEEEIKLKNHGYDKLKQKVGMIKQQIRDFKLNIKEYKNITSPEIKKCIQLKTEVTGIFNDNKFEKSKNLHDLTKKIFALKENHQKLKQQNSELQSEILKQKIEIERLKEKLLQNQGQEEFNLFSYKNN
ncbi:MAG: hypothetical protein PVI75_00925 [Gammaproteobacteria bacterium]|jgi:hypothetical protein